MLRLAGQDERVALMTRRKDPEPDAEPALAHPDAVAPEISVLPEKASTEARQPALEMPEPQPDPIPMPPAPKPAHPRSGLPGTLLGGALAAIGGFALSQFDLLGLAPKDQTAELAALSASLAQARSDQSAALTEQASQIAALADRLSAVEASPAPDPSGLEALDQRVAAIEAMPADGTATSAALAARLADLEQRLASVTASDASGLQQQLTAALARLDEAEAAATAQAAEAEAAAASARRAQALDALGAAVTEGRPFAAELEALADSDLSAALGAMAAAGVPTLATLQADFPDAARAALGISRATNPEDGWSDRLVDFLAAQTGARPVTPTEGTTPEAILSRAEFALSEGRLTDALAELQPLDPAVKAPLDAWIAAATAHVAATTALQAAGGQ